MENVNQTIKKLTRAEKQRQEDDQIVNQILDREHEQKKVQLDQIDFDPQNRKRFKPGTIEELAKNIQLVGVIHDITLRKMENGRYMVVQGEKRTRASLLAGLPDIPAKVYSLTDGEARRIRFSENAFREDLHFLQEAWVIAELEEDYPNVDGIASKLGKAKSFVMGRMQLNQLIKPIQEMTLEDKFTFRQAISISLLDQQSQEAFFDQYCKDWRKASSFMIYDLEAKLRKFKFNLLSAPFDIKSKTLCLEAGACTTCQHNSAVVQSIFPGEEKEAYCNKHSCYQQKCFLNFSLKLLEALLEIKPEALLTNGDPSPLMQQWVANIPAAQDIPIMNIYDVSALREPRMPEMKNYKKYEGGKFVHDSTEYKKATEQYLKLLDEYKIAIEVEGIKVGLYIFESGVRVVYYDAKQTQETSLSEKTMTVKEVQHAIKAGTAAPEQVKEQLVKAKQREFIKQAGDRQIVQTEIYDNFSNQLKDNPRSKSLTIADQVCSRFLIFQSLSYNAEQSFLKRLFPKTKDTDAISSATLFEKFKTLDKLEFSYLIRIALLQNPDSKNSKSRLGYILEQVAEAAGINIKAIKEKQAEVAKERQKRGGARIKVMEQYLKKKTA
jgi:ParB/RepB/Spo0J family partition protein